MKLLKFTQTHFINTQGENKVILAFDEILEGASLEITGQRHNITSVTKACMLPSVKVKTAVSIVLHLPGGECITYIKTLKPVPRVKVGLMDCSYEPEGCEDYVNRQGEGFARILDSAVKLFKEFPDYKYTVQNMGMLYEYQKYRETNLGPYIKKGNLSFGRLIRPVHLSGLGLESAISAVSDDDYSQFAVLEGGISAEDAELLLTCGVKNVILIQRGNRRPEENTDIPPLFTVKPEGFEKGINVFRVPDISLPKELLSRSHVSLPDKGGIDGAQEYLGCRIALNKIDSNLTENFFEEYINLFEDIDFIPYFNFNPRSLPCIMLKALCDDFASRWEYPRLIMCTPDECMGKLNGLLCFTEDIPDSDGDSLTAIPSIISKKEELEREYTSLEALCAIRSMENSMTEYPKPLLNNVSDGILSSAVSLFATEKNPPEMHMFNYSHIFENSISKAKAGVSEILSSSESRTDKFITFFNPLPYERQMFLYSYKPLSGVVCQKTEGGYISELQRLPAFGSKSFPAGEEKTEPGFASVTSKTIETPYYKISFNAQTGRIESILNSNSLTELIDPLSPYSLGDFVYQSKDSINIQKTSSVKIVNGPVFVSINRYGIEEQSGAEAVSKIIFYRLSKRIDVEVEFSNAASLMGDFEDRYSKNIFYAFPLKCENSTFKSRGKIGITDEIYGKLPLGTRDFTVSPAVSVENESRGIAVISKDMPVFHLGDIKYNRLSKDFIASSSSIFLYAASNRTNQLTFKTAEDCRGKYRLSVIPYDTANGFSEEENGFLYPPYVYEGYEVERSFISVNHKDIELSAFRPKDNGFLVRVANRSKDKLYSGINLPFKISKVYVCTAHGHEIQEYSGFENGTISFGIRNGSHLTFKVIPQKEYQIKYSAEGNDIVRHSYSYVSHCKRAVAVWEKAYIPQGGKFEILSGGEKIAEADNQNYLTQLYMTELKGCHDFEIVYKKSTAE